VTVQRTVAELVHVLTQEHASFLEGTLRYEDALILRLRTAIRASMGMTHGGHSLPHERSAMNLAAFTTYEFVTETASAMLGAAQDEVPDRRQPMANLREWLRHWQRAEHTGELTEVQVLTARRRLGDLVSRIENALAPSKVIEIVGACPNPECGERYWSTDTHGSRTSALFSAPRVGEPVKVRCHWCDTSWEGEEQLVELNRLMRVAEEHHRAVLAGEFAVDNATDHGSTSDDAGHEHHEQETA
jgi:hypothetical protein